MRALVTNPILALQIALGVLTAIFVVGWSAAVRAIRRGPALEPSPATDTRFPDAPGIVIGAVTNFFDTLGIGSFATTTSPFLALGLVPDGIPGTLNVGTRSPRLHRRSSTSLIEVDIRDAGRMIAAAVLGTWLGAGIVAGWPSARCRSAWASRCSPRRPSCSWRLLSQSRPRRGVGAPGAMLVVGVVGNFMLGALMTLGIGLYAPCMILVSLLGMKPATAFPIMMGSCAFLMPVGSVPFIGEGATPAGRARARRSAASRRADRGVHGEVAAARRR